MSAYLYDAFVQWFNTIHIPVKLRMGDKETKKIEKYLLLTRSYQRMQKNKKAPGAWVSSNRKKILKSYRANLINGGPAKAVSTGAETCPKIIQGLLKVRNKEARYFRN